VDNGILVYNPALYSRLPYDPDRDFAGIGFIGRFPLYLVVRPDSPHRDFAGFLAASRTRAPTYGTPAVASPHHLAMELVKRRSGLQAEHVPYRGGPAAMQDLLAGNVDSVVIDTATGTPFIRDNRVRTLCALTEAARASRPAVPTVRELGHDAVAYGWQGHERAGRDARAGGRAPGGGDDPRHAVGRDRAAAARPRHRVPALVAGGVPGIRRRENALWRPLIRELGIRLDS
jgi:hypothetical protein